MKTFKEAFDLLTRAYISGAVDPWDCKACFVGNLLGNTEKWGSATHEISVRNKDYGEVTLMMLLNLALAQEDIKESREFIDTTGYTPEEVQKLEHNFLRILVDNSKDVDPMLNEATIYAGSAIRTDNGQILSRKEASNYEDALFLAFKSTLEMLKGIHQAKGEIIEETPAFVKRNLELV